MSQMVKCDHCGQECGPGPDWTAEDAEREAREIFVGEIPEAERRVICDDCWQEFLPWMERTYGPGPWPANPGETL